MMMMMMMMMMMSIVLVLSQSQSCASLVSSRPVFGLSLKNYSARL